MSLFTDEEYGSLSAEDRVMRAIEERGVSMAWVSKKTGYSYSHLNNVLKGKGMNKSKLTEKVLSAINEALGTNFSNEKNKANE